MVCPQGFVKTLGVAGKTWVEHKELYSGEVIGLTRV